MKISEAHAWSLTAPPAEVQSVKDAAACARGDWFVQMRQPEELRHVGCWALGGWFDPQGAANAAAEAAVELAIIVHLWPLEARHELRPSWE